MNAPNHQTLQDGQARDAMVAPYSTADSGEAVADTVCVDPTTDPIWRRLVQERRSDIFHSPEWMRVLQSTYGFELRALVALDGSGKPVAGIPYGRISDPLGQRIASLPFSDYCDPLVEEPAVWSSLAGRLLDEGLPATLRCLHNDLPLSDRRFTLAKRAKWHGMDLRPDLESLWLGLDESARRAIRKAQRDGVVVRVAEGSEDLHAFFRMHAGLRKYKYRLLAQPYRFMENIWRHLIEKQRGLLMVAAYGKEIIGGVLFLEWKDRLYYKFNASSPAHLGHRPNDRILWEGIQYGKAKGYTSLDFGLSDWDQEELARYKLKYASEEKTISFLRHEPKAGPSEQEKELRRLLGQITDLFVDESVPDRVTDAAGEILYRFFV